MASSSLSSKLKVWDKCSSLLPCLHTTGLLLLQSKLELGTDSLLLIWWQLLFHGWHFSSVSGRSSSLAGCTDSSWKCVGFLLYACRFLQVVYDSVELVKRCVVRRLPRWSNLIARCLLNDIGLVWPLSCMVGELFSGFQAMDSVGRWRPGSSRSAMSPVLETGVRKTLWSSGGNWTLFLFNKIVEITVSETGSR